ncbi:MAG: VTT domain-containing protein [Burkholderiales bacterium]|nr:VTT domain-containing protein [Burkholderiales bacterium]
MTEVARDRPRGRGILRPGENCWRVARADRAALLVDGDAYFSALRQAARNAEHSIFIVGWDIDSRIPFPPGAQDDGLPATLGKFLDALIERKRALQIYVLDWDFALLYAPDREILPIYNLGWRTHKRLHFHLDDRHPPGASHHQKIVVVDDALAFVGGLDLTKGRWDTPRHAPDEPDRRSPDGKPYAPFHDTQLMVEGAAAAALGELARRRWRRATGHDAQAVGPPAGDGLWPPGVEAEFRDIDVAIARTEPEYEGAAPVREVLQLYLDGIRAAKRSIYIENQYFTAVAIGRAIEERLAESDGPEIVIVTRRAGGGWLEQNTMGLLRARLIRHLVPRDRHGRLRVYCPEQAGLGEECIDLHSKLMIVDDRLLRVGSANLNNRSMGVDTECDLAIEARSPDETQAIAHIRERLLAEHLGVEPQQFAQALERHGSLIGAIEALQGRDRSLSLLEPTLDPDIDRLMPDADVIDPEQPVDPERLVEEIVPADERPHASRRILAVTLLLLLAAGLALAWRWGPLHQWLDVDTLRALSREIERSPWAPAWMLGAYVGASLAAMPITVLIVATAFAFGPWTTVAYALSGSLLGGGLTFALGHALGRRVVRQIAGKRLNALSRRLGEGGVFAVMVLRMLPVAPFTVVNLVAGASHVRMRDFLIGTALGMTPGILAVAVFSDRLAAALRDPTPGAIALLALVLVAVAGGALGIRWWLRRHSRKRAAEQA